MSGSTSTSSTLPLICCTWIFISLVAMMPMAAWQMSLMQWAGLFGRQPLWILGLKNATSLVITADPRNGWWTFGSICGCGSNEFTTARCSFWSDLLTELAMNNQRANVGTVAKGVETSLDHSSVWNLIRLQLVCPNWISPLLPFFKFWLVWQKLLQQGLAYSPIWGFGHQIETG